MSTQAELIQNNQTTDVVEAHTEVPVTEEAREKPVLSMTLRKCTKNLIWTQSVSVLMTGYRNTYRKRFRCRKKPPLRPVMTLNEK